MKIWEREDFSPFYLHISTKVSFSLLPNFILLAEINEPKAQESLITVYILTRGMMSVWILLHVQFKLYLSTLGELVEKDNLFSLVKALYIASYKYRTAREDTKQPWPQSYIKKKPFSIL